MTKEGTQSGNRIKVPSYNVNTNDSSLIGNLKWIKIYVQKNQKYEKALLDNCAGISLIDKNYAEGLQLTKINVEPIVLEGAGNHIIHNFGRVKFNIYIEDKLYTIYPIIIKHFNPKILLGSEFLVQNNVEISYLANSLSLSDPSNPLNRIDHY